MSDGGLAGGDDRPARAAEPTSQPARRTGRGLAAFATLLALVALGLTAYPYYRRAVEGEPTDAAAALDALRTEQQRQADQLRDLLDSRAVGVAVPADAVVAQARPTAPVGTTPLSSESRRALQLAEAELLLRNANEHLLVDRDPRAALPQVLAAQSLVDAVDDGASAAVRTSLTKQVATLRGAADVDVAALVRRVQALIVGVADLPARGVRFGTAAQQTANEVAPTSAWETAWRKFRSLFAFRREGASQRPPLGPDAATYLRLNLALMLQNAQFALLRRDADGYQQSLSTVRHWLDDYLDTSAPAVADVRAEIDRLADVRLDRPLPDLADSLDALRTMLDAAADPSRAATPAAIDTSVSAGDGQTSERSSDRSAAGEAR